MKRRGKKPSKKRKRFKWSTFICHVTADKKDFVTALAKELQKFGVTVWLDEFILTVGDSLRQKIDEGLSKSRYGVVAFSPSFFEKKWPQTELDGLFAREMEGKRKIILPSDTKFPFPTSLKRFHCSRENSFWIVAKVWLPLLANS